MFAIVLCFTYWDDIIGLWCFFVVIVGLILCLLGGFFVCLFGFFISFLTALSNYRIWLSFFLLSQNLHQKAFYDISLYMFSVCTIYVMCGWFCLWHILLKNYFEGRSSDILGWTLPRKMHQRRARVSGPVPAEHVSTVGICTFIMSVFSGWVILVDFF